MGSPFHGEAARSPAAAYDGICPQVKSPAPHRAGKAAASPSRGHGGASSSARRQNPPQDVPENAGLQLKRARAVVLVVSRGHHDNEIKLRDDANRLPASTKRASPVDLTPIVQGAAEKPQVSIKL